MKISFRNPVELNCPACASDLTAEAWLILDAQEAPEAVAELKAGQLNSVSCPQCGHQGQIAAPLLFHDRGARRVIFAPAPGSSEHEIRDQARELHALLVGSLSEEERRPYLTDVDVTQDLAGVARLIARYERHTQRAAAVQSPATPPAVPAPPHAEDSLLVAVHALLSADNSAELEAAIAAHPLLLDPASDGALAQLAQVAAEQGEREIAESLSQARFLLARTAEVMVAAPAAVPANRLPDEILSGLLAAQNRTELEALIAHFPLLASVSGSALLAQAIDEALDAGDERVASLLAQRLEALQPQAQSVDPQLEDAIEALLLADDQATISAALSAYPVLLSETAVAALWQFAAEARAASDEELAQHAIERRELLRRIRREAESEV